FKHQPRELSQRAFRTSHQAVDVLDAPQVRHTPDAHDFLRGIRKYEPLEAVRVDSVLQHHDAILAKAIVCDERFLSDVGISERRITERAHEPPHHAMPPCEPVPEVVPHAKYILDAAEFRQWCAKICGILEVHLQHIGLLLAPERTQLACSSHCACTEQLPH